jgi:hypothetical protein
MSGSSNDTVVARRELSVVKARLRSREVSNKATRCLALHSRSRLLRRASAPETVRRARKRCARPVARPAHEDFRGDDEAKPGESHPGDASAWPGSRALTGR